MVLLMLDGVDLLLCISQPTNQVCHFFRLLKIEEPIARLTIGNNQVNIGNFPAAAANFLGVWFDHCNALVGYLNIVFAGFARAAPGHFVVHHSSYDTFVCDDVEGILHGVNYTADAQWDAWQAQG